MKAHIIHFFILLLGAAGVCTAAILFGRIWGAETRFYSKETFNTRQALISFQAKQSTLNAQAERGTAFRDYRSKWEARSKDYNTSTKVVEILNAEASRANVNPPQFDETKSVGSALDLVTFGRLSDLVRWVSAVEQRIDLLTIEDIACSSQPDSTVLLHLRARVLGGLTAATPDAKGPNTSPVPARPAVSR